MLPKVHVAELRVSVLVYGYVVYGGRIVYMIGYFMQRATLNNKGKMQKGNKPQYR